jgi:hypothetical protein
MAVQPANEGKLRFVEPDGRVIYFRFLPNLSIDDILINGMKAEGFRVIHGQDSHVGTTKNVKDYLIKTLVLQDLI